MTEPKFETTEDPTRFSWDVFYQGPDGFGEHIQAVATRVDLITNGRAMVLDWLKTIGAGPQARDRGPIVRPTAPAPEPMVAAAQQVFPGATPVGRVCPKHNMAMNFVPPGFSQRLNKTYPGFWVCDAEKGCRG